MESRLPLMGCLTPGRSYILPSLSFFTCDTGINMPPLRAWQKFNEKSVSSMQHSAWQRTGAKAVTRSSCPDLGPRERGALSGMGVACVRSVESSPFASQTFQMVVLSKAPAKGPRPGLPATHSLRRGMAGFLAFRHSLLCK